MFAHSTLISYRKDIMAALFLNNLNLLNILQKQKFLLGIFL